MAFGRTGQIWVATTGGLSRRVGAGFVEVSRDPALKDDSISALWVDERNDIWLGSRTKGLYRFHEGRVTHYTRNEGLPDSQVFSILEDQDRNLWMTCRKGIYRISIQDVDRFDDQKSRRIPAVIYESLDGLKSSEINYSAKPPAMRTQIGRFWLATYGGVAVVDPAHLAVSHDILPVYIERLVTNGVGLRSGTSVTLRPTQRNLEIHYTALSFRAPQRVRFRYRMEGFETD